MTLADVAPCRDVRDPQTSLLALNLPERSGHDGVHACVPEAFDEKPLEHVNELLWCVQARPHRRARETPRSRSA